MVNAPRQGEIWWAEAEDKRRPVLVVTRSDAIGVLERVVVAPVTRTVRGIPTEVALGRDEGLREPCAASFDNLLPLSRGVLTSRVGRLAPERSVELCAALEALADC
jgi:mRNA interferase MazF